QHQPAAQELAIRVGGDQRKQLADHLRCPLERQVQIGQLLAGDQQAFIETGPCRLHESSCRARERLSPPQVQTLAEQMSSLRGVPLRAGPSIPQQALEQAEVNLVRRYG